jgi:aspartate kinase
VGLIVQKYGGTSMGSVDRIQRVAKRVAKTRAKGHDVVVVVSAMSGETDRLIKLAKAIEERPDVREYDALISTGENVTTALLAIALNAMKRPAISFAAHQVKILTDSVHAKARIESIDDERIREELKKGRIVVVAGFQGVDAGGDVTTLGRGGSDTTAVALAAALKADVCEIYSDVDGVYTTDPRIVPEARKLKKIAYEAMLEQASLGAKVLQIRSVEFAAKYGIPVRCRSTFSNDPGTLVTREDRSMEKEVVSGVTYNKDEAKINIRHVPDQPGIASKIFTPIGEANINVDMIIQNVSREGFTDVTFTVPKGDLWQAMKIVKATAKEIGAKGVTGDSNVAKISVVGVGMRSHSGVATRMFGALAKEGINIQMISTSEIKISCVIEEKYTELAVRVLHDAFELANGALGAEPKVTKKRAAQ